MSNYRVLKQQHETAVVDDFVAWLSDKSGANWTVLERPDTPDAVISNGVETSWVEHTDLYRTWEEARSETSFITPDKKHIPHAENPIFDPDRRIAIALMNLLQSKLSNDSYRQAYEVYGPGFLVISERDPLFNKDSIAEIDRISEEIKISDDRGYFSKVCLAIRAVKGTIYGELTYLRA
jgi:hypothetical protein